MPSTEPTEDGPQPADIALDLLQLASWCHALGDREKRDVAIQLAADLLGPTRWG